MADAIRLDDLLQLPRDKRARFARALIESLEDVTEEDAEMAWIDELERRALDARSNPQASQEWSEVRERLAARLRNRQR